MKSANNPEKSSPRAYSHKTLKKLYGLSGNRCAFPGCNRTFLHWENDNNFSNICHIEDANQSPNTKDRYNPNMTDKERADYENLILLCQVHHEETNDPDKYGVDTLKEMKRAHEKKILQILSGTNLLGNNPSALITVINELGGNLIEGSGPENILVVANPEEKIRHNNIIEYQPIINEFKVYQGKLNKIYEEIEGQASTRKEVLLRNIRTIYLREAGKFREAGGVVKNADKIIENIERELLKRIDENPRLDQNLPIEAIEMAILVIIVDAFLRCEIFEKPLSK
ncbi:MAG: hypothetical protein H6581_21150 [Bacteroidia bacterium]|nr:hypothetical protein [Bacteroidia bacterium]